MEIEKKNEMNLLPEDMWRIILARLPLSIITTSKLVCKQWKSLVESPFFRDLFLSHHQNSHSSWSLMFKGSEEEVVGYYACKIWGLPRTPAFYINSFITEYFDAYNYVKVKVKAYTDVGLILIRSKSWRNDIYVDEGPTYYVANPILRQCVKIPHPPPIERFRVCGLATRIENEVLLGYKIVMVDTSNWDVLSLLIYSSETGLWSYKTLQSHIPLVWIELLFANPISLNGNLYWIDSKRYDYGEVIVSYDFYATGPESDRCQVTIFPDVPINLKFKRVCTTSQGFIMYMNIVSESGKDDGHVGHKLRVWRLKSGEWQLVSEISPACSKIGQEYYPVAVNPFDASTIYMWCETHTCLAFTNLEKDKSGIHNYFEHSSDSNYEILPFVVENIFHDFSYVKRSRSFFNFPMFVLPRWLHQIPSSPSRAK